jgi:hypothetical protein
MDPHDSQGRLATILVKQDDRLQKIESKLDAHEASERTRWEEHIKEHREHDRTHSDIAQRQLKIEDRLHAGAETMSDGKRRLSSLENANSPPSWPKVAATIFGALATVAVVVGWFYAQLETKADKSVEQRLELKADRSEVQAFNKAFLEAIEKVSKLH